MGWIPPEQIRGVAIGVVHRGEEILVFEGYDPSKGQTFFRPLGGGPALAFYAAKPCGYAKFAKYQTSIPITPQSAASQSPLKTGEGCRRIWATNAQTSTASWKTTKRIGITARPYS